MAKRKQKSDEVADNKEQEVSATAEPVAEVPNTLSTKRNSSAFERQEHIEAQQAKRREEEELADVISSFVLASKSGNLMESEVAGIYADGADVCWMCNHGPITVRIPFKETFDDLPPDLLNDDHPRVGQRRRQFLSKSIGLNIRYIVTEFKPDPNDRKRAIVIGSRIKAMEKIRKSYFGPDAYRPIKKGDIVNAQILSVGDHVAWVTFRGVDVRVGAGGLSHRYQQDMSKVYATGQKIKVQVTHVSEDAETGRPIVKVSARPLELEDSKTRQHLAPRGSVFAATITAKTVRINEKNPGVIISLWLENVDIPGFSNTHAMIKDTFVSGDKVYVEVLGYSRDGYAHCKLLRRAGNSI